MTQKRVPIIEEQVDVDTRTVETGVVRTKTSVEERTETVDLALRRDDVEVHRVPVNRVVDAPVPTRQEGDTTIISLHEEVPVVTTRLVVVEEIHLRLRRSVQDIKQPVTLRRERMDVERQPPDSAGNASSEVRFAKEEPKMATTLAGIFDRAEDAQRASAELTRLGIEERSVRMTSPQGGDEQGGMASGESRDDRGFFSRLFGLGDDDEQSGTYAEAVRRGGYVVTVHLENDSQADRVADILENAGAIDVRNREEAWRAGGYTGHDASAGPYTQDEAERDRQTLQVMQEEIKVGKRAVEGGGVRVHRYTTERPVSEELQLHEERVFVDRRPVDRPATQDELDALGSADKDIELREMSEEAVVSKTARVVEEVEIGKEARDRTERIEDTVRRTDVDVERIDPQGTREQRSSQEQPRSDR